MQCRLLHNLGTDDARKCVKDFGCDLTIDARELAAGKVIELTDIAAKYLFERYPGLCEEVRARGAVKLPESSTAK